MSYVIGTFPPRSGQVRSVSIRAIVGRSVGAGLLWGFGLFYPLLLTVEGTWPERVAGLVALTFLLTIVLVSYMVFVSVSIYTFRIPFRTLPVFAPAIWVVLEFAMRKGVVGFAPYIGVTQWQAPLLLRLSTFTGIHGVSWLIVAINSLIVVVLSMYWGTQPKSGTHRLNRIAPIVLFLVGLAALGGALDSIQMNAESGKVADRRDGTSTSVDGSVAAGDLNLLLIQPNISPERYMYADDNPDEYDTILDELIIQSEKALTRPHTVLVWPETVLHIHGWDNSTVREKINTLLTRWDSHLVVGLPRSPFSPKLNSRAAVDRQYNSLFVIGKNHDLLGVYDKVNVIPIAEAEFDPGWAIDPVFLNGHMIGLGICSDAVVADHALAAVRAGATSLHYVASLGQIPPLAPLERAFVVFRAAEHHVYATQTATTGPSLVVNPYGKVISSLSQDQKGAVEATIPVVDNKPTIYTKYGDWIVALSGLIVMAVAVVPFIKFSKR